MPSALCLLHANCQGDALRPLLENSPAFSRFFRIRQYTNYTRQSIAEADLKQCALFLHQRLTPRWGALASEQLLPRLAPSCQVVEIPNLFFKGYWPFWTNATKAVNFADSLLERLLAQGLAPEEALHLYLRGEPALLGDVAAVAEDSLAREEVKEAQAPIRCARLLRERWQEEQLFVTVNHPGKTLLFHVADCLLRLLGLGRLSRDARRSYAHPHEDFWLPIHPALGPLLGLPFASRERRYPVFAARLTHREYTSCYLACRSHAVTDLLTVLRALPPSGKMRAA